MEREPSKQFSDLVELVAILRRECPWDRKQTHDSIKDNLIEEAYEAVDAIDRRDFEELKKELGDLLLHVLFQTRLADETGRFTVDDVVYGIQEKLIRRHPHVFDNVKVNGEEEVAQNWESIKLKEGKKSVLDGLPKHLPALIRAQRMQEKAANVGFDWPEHEQVWDKLEEELHEFREAVTEGDQQKSADEYGDLLFSLVNYGRFFDLNAEDSLRLTNTKFEQRFRYIEEKLAEKGRKIDEVSLEVMDRYWNEAKNRD